MVQNLALFYRAMFLGAQLVPEPLKGNDVRPIQLLLTSDFWRKFAFDGSFLRSARDTAEYLSDSKVSKSWDSVKAARFPNIWGLIGYFYWMPTQIGLRVKKTNQAIFQFQPQAFQEYTSSNLTKMKAELRLETIQLLKKGTQKTDCWLPSGVVVASFQAIGWGLCCGWGALNQFLLQGATDGMS